MEEIDIGSEEAVVETLPDCDEITHDHELPI